MNANNFEADMAVVVTWDDVSSDSSDTADVLQCVNDASRCKVSGNISLSLSHTHTHIHYLTSFPFFLSLFHSFISYHSQFLFFYPIRCFCKLTSLKKRFSPVYNITFIFLSFLNPILIFFSSRPS